MLEAMRPSSSEIPDFMQQTSKSSRILTQRINYERFVHSQKQRNLQKESQAIKDCIEREEKDVIKQLMRLEEEKHMFLKRDELPGEEIEETISWKEPKFLDELVNPYPVTLPGGLSLRRRLSLDVPSRPKQRVSAEYEDLDTLSSNSRLPPLVCNSGTSSSASLHGHLQRSSSWVTLHKHDKPNLCFDKPAPWVGDPEAIDSIRRPLRGPLRSPRSPGGSVIPEMIQNAQIKRCLRSIARSHSMKEKCSTDAKAILRSRSLKERPKKQVDEVNDAMSDCDITGSGTFYRRRAIRARHPLIITDLPKGETYQPAVEEPTEDGSVVSSLRNVCSSTLLKRRNAKK